MASIADPLWLFIQSHAFMYLSYLAESSSSDQRLTAELKGNYSERGDFQIIFI